MIATQRTGILSSDFPEELHPTQAAFLGKNFATFRTCGDGACALHGVWGEPSSGRDLKYVRNGGNAREDMYKFLLPERFQDFRRTLSVDHIERCKGRLNICVYAKRRRTST